MSRPYNLPIPPQLLSASRPFSLPSTPNPAAALNKSLDKKKTNVALATLAYIIAEGTRYNIDAVGGVEALEKRLSDWGYQVGARIHELAVWREKNSKREIRLVRILQFVQTTVWKALFDKAADGLQKSTENQDEYMLIDNEPRISKFISVPKDMGGLSVATFLAGLVEAVMDQSLCPSRVTAHTMPEEGFPIRTVILIKVDKTVSDREKILDGVK